MPIVEQLLNGVKVQCADGTVIPCRPLPLGAAMDIIDQWNIRGDVSLTPEVRADARIAILKRFATTYPPRNCGARRDLIPPMVGTLNANSMSAILFRGVVEQGLVNLALVIKLP